jgi:D-alanyl-D-alanine carboxypeptidase
MPGFRAGIQVDLASGDGVAVMANSTATTGAAVANDLLAILAEREPKLPDEWAPAPVDPDALALTGAWFWGPAPYVLRALRDGRLELARGGEFPGECFRANGDGTYTGVEGYHAGELLLPVRDAGGAVVKLEVASWAFTRTPYDPAADVPGGVDPGGWRT